MKEIIYTTNCLCFTEAQAAQYLKNKVSSLNYEILVAHLCNPELARKVEGFSEQNHVLFLKVGGEMISITKCCRN